MTTSSANLSWQDIQKYVMTQIRAGSWKPGDAIPNEADLARDLGCARTTVNRALRELAAEGLLERKRKAGTRVAKYPTRRAKLHIPLIRDEITESGREYRYQRLAFEPEVAPVNLPDALKGCPRIAYVEALHFANDEPFVHEARWINTVAVPAKDHNEFADISANEWLVRNAPFTEGTLEFFASDVPADVATHLQCAPGSAVFNAKRQTRAQTQLVTVVVLSYAPGYRKLLAL